MFTKSKFSVFTPNPKMYHGYLQLVRHKIKLGDCNLPTPIKKENECYKYFLLILYHYKDLTVKKLSILLLLLVYTYIWVLDITKLIKENQLTSGINMSTWSVFVSWSFLSVLELLLVSIPSIVSSSFLTSPSITHNALFTPLLTISNISCKKQKSFLVN